MGFYFPLASAVFTQKRYSCGDAPKDICPSVSQTWFQLSLITAPVVSDQSLLHTMCSFYCRTAQIWKLCSKNRQTAATPTVLFAVTMSQIQSLFFFFCIIWGLFRAPLLQPVSKEKDGVCKRWKQLSWGRFLSWISLSLMLFWKPQLLLSVDYKDQIPFFLKKKKKLLSLTITEKSHENMTEVLLQSSKKEAREKSQTVISLTTLF